MSNLNYFSGIVKILKIVKEDSIAKQRQETIFYVEVPQNRKNKIIALVFWGKLGREVRNFYKKNDYILIEGYSSIRSSRVKKPNPQSSRNLKQVVITVLKVYPILLNRK